MQLVMTSAFAQNSTLIWGTVTDEKGTPLPFATIYLSNGARIEAGTATDLDGFFEIEIPATPTKADLTASYCGYQPKTIAWENNQNSNEIDFKLKEGIELVTIEVIHRGPLVIQEFTGCWRSLTSEWNPPLIEIKLSFERNYKAYPNPFISTLNVEMEVKTAQVYLFHLYNEAGQLVLAESRELETGQQNFQLDLVQRHLPEGAYFLRISDDAGEIRTKRLVKVSP